MDDLQRLARAFADHIDMSWEEASDRARAHAKEIVRDLLAELRIPSEGMLDAISVSAAPAMRLAYRAIFTAMIDSILSQESE